VSGSAARHDNKDTAMDDTIGHPDPGLDLSGGFRPHTSHWGVFSARQGASGLEVRAYAGDPDPNGIIDNFPGALRHQARIAQPAIRRGWLERGPGSDARRGRDEFVSVSWEKALDVLGDELARIRDTSGPGAVFGGSYGWSSAGRFHHAQSQVHRFLNIAMGGYVRSVNSYSSGASSVLLPQILAGYEEITKRNVTWEQIAGQSEIVLAFGGMALKNSMVAGGSIGKHVERGAMAAARKRGCEFILISPLRDDLPVEAGAEWMTCVPGTDTALMLGIVHTLVSEGLHDQSFLDRYAEGWPVFLRYLTGETDGAAKSAEWAAAISGFDAATIRELARRLAGRRALITVSHSLQRAEHGEQPVWMGMVLAAVLGQIGLPGGGYAYSLGAIGYYGRRVNDVPGRRWGRAATALRISFRWRASPTCCSIPAPPIATMVRRAPIRTSVWSTGPAAIPSITTRTSIACARPLPRSIRWSCTSWPGPPRPATPTSCCPRP
jgi:biotin/methionine sulfoxide reductase